LKKESIAIPHVLNGLQLLSQEHFNEAVQAEHNLLERAMAAI